MPRCSYRHDAFKVKNGYQHDSTVQCWLTDVGNFGREEETEHFCLFHAPLEKEPSDRNDWPIEERGAMQAEQLKTLLEQWNTENELKKDNLLAFVLPGMKCGTIDLRNFTFTGGVLLNDAIFSGDTWFISSIFSKDSIFKSTTFSGDVGFEHATFKGGAKFNSATFKGCSWFNSATFSDNAWFNSATFGFARFDSATFSWIARFDSATFSEAVAFKSTTFLDNASFNSAIFLEDVGFNSATFSENAEFKSVTFKRFITFTNAEFKSTTDFSKASFTEAPLFHNAELHQSTDFRGAEFQDKKLRRAPPAYRTLKIAMGKVRSHKEEADFYALEMESNLNQPDTPLSVKLFTHIYCVISDYGRSFIRPLGWLVFITVLFSMIYSVLLVYSNNVSLLPHNSPYYFQFSIEQIVKPFSIWSYKGSEVIRSYAPNQLLLFQVLSSIQSIVSITLITLFLLAIRRKFKLG